MARGVSDVGRGTPPPGVPTLKSGPDRALRFKRSDSLGPLFRVGITRAPDRSPTCAGVSRTGSIPLASLVEWFNSVDATYRSDLRELNELNFARFDAKVVAQSATTAALVLGVVKLTH